MSNNPEQDDLFQAADVHFQAGRYAAAEPLLNQLILRGSKRPDVFHMLGTIYYDQGKFSKAIRSFKRALEIEPTFTDASIGLSIILNDLGRYDEGRKVFEEAKELLSRGATKDDPYINEKFALKHDELGEMYFRYQRFKEALEQYYRALTLSRRKPELTMKIVECLLRLGDRIKALRDLRQLCQEYPEFTTARIKLGALIFEGGDVAGAVCEWEAVLEREPNNSEAQRLITAAQAAGRTTTPELTI